MMSLEVKVMILKSTGSGESRMTRMLALTCVEQCAENVLSSLFRRDVNHNEEGR